MNIHFLTDPLTKFFYMVNGAIHTIIPNNDLSYGLAIIVFTIIVRIIILPLSVKQLRSTAKMGAIQPEMKKVQAKYKGDPQKAQQEVMKLYKENGVNPMGGCLPMIVQMPILFSLYYVFQNINMHGAGFIHIWIPNLTKPDPLYILPILSTVTTYFSSKLMQPPTTDGSSNKQTSTMNTGMAIFMGFMSLKFKSALVLYWVTNNLIQIVQTVVINKIELNKKPNEAVANIDSSSSSSNSNSNSNKKNNKK